MVLVTIYVYTNLINDNKQAIFLYNLSNISCLNMTEAMSDPNESEYYPNICELMLSLIFLAIIKIKEKLCYLCF